MSNDTGAVDGSSTDELDQERVRNFIGLAVARVGPRAFDVTHNTFLTLFIGARTGSAFLVAVALTGHRFFSWLVWPLAGRVSDATRSRFGRRAPYLGGGLVVMGTLTWSYTLIGGFWPLVAAIVVARTANTIRNLAGITVVPETFGRSRWIRALIATAVAGFVVSLSVRITVIATWSDDDPTTWNLAFRMAGAFMVIAGLVVFAFVRDGTPARRLAEIAPPKEPWRERLAEIMAVPNARLLLAGAFLTVAASGSTSRLLPLFNQEELGAGGSVQSAAIIVGGIGGLVLAVPAGVVLSMRLRRSTLAVLGPGSAAAGALLHLVVTDIWQTVVIGIVTAAFGVGTLIALAALLLQLLPRSGGMGERLGLVLGPFALVGVLSTLASAATVDHLDSFRVMWLFPAALGTANAIVNARLWIPPWAERVDIRRALRTMGPWRRARRGDGEAAGRNESGRRDLFRGEVNVDDVDASVVFEVLRHALGNPYEPAKDPSDDEPEPARIARKVLVASSAPDARAMTEVAELVHDDVTLDDDGVDLVGQPAVLEHLTGPDWSPWPVKTPGRWQLSGVDGDVVSFQASPAPSTGEVQVAVRVVDGCVTRIERRTTPTSDDGGRRPRPVSASSEFRAATDAGTPTGYRRHR